MRGPDRLSAPAPDRAGAPVLARADIAGLAPVGERERLFSLDVIRGFAVLGILAVNAMTFAFPSEVSANPTLQPAGFEGAAVDAWRAMHILFQDKMRGLFSMLFGVSLFLIGGQRDDAARGRLLRRRLGWLALFGAVHGAAFWYGDILLLYAWTGLFVLLARSWSGPRLLAVGTGLSLACSGLYLGLIALVGLGPPEALAGAMHDAGWSLAADEIQRRIAEMRGGALSVSWAVMREWLSAAPMMLLAFAPSTGALMLIGMGLFKTGFFSGRAPAWLYVGFVAAGALSLGLIDRETAAWSAAGYPFVAGLMKPANTLLAPVVSLAYAAGLMLLARWGLRPLLHPLAAVGRMAFTNYLTQTLIMTGLFYGGRGLGLYGQIGWPEMWLVIGAVWIAQLIGSPLWLSRFSMGPFEWLWRRLAYGRPLPLSRPPH